MDEGLKIEPVTYGVNLSIYVNINRGFSEKTLDPWGKLRQEEYAFVLSFLGSSVVEQATVNRLVAGSNPARGAIFTKKFICRTLSYKRMLFISVKRERNDSTIYGSSLMSFGCMTQEPASIAALPFTSKSSSNSIWYVETPNCAAIVL